MGDLQTFNQTKFISNLCTYLNIRQSEVSITVSAASIKVTTSIQSTSLSIATDLREKLSIPIRQLSSLLDVSIERIDSYLEQIASPSPPSDVLSDEFIYWYWLSPILVISIVIASYFLIRTIFKPKMKRARISTTNKVMKKNDNILNDEAILDEVELLPLKNKKTKLPTCRKDMIPT